MRASRTGAVTIAVAVAAGVLLAACAGGSTDGGSGPGAPASSGASGAAFAPVGPADLEDTGTLSVNATIVVPTTTVVSADGDAQVTVQIEVGGGAPATVLLDTGSSGLLIDSSAVGSQVTDTGQQLDEGFVSGTVTATLGRAPVTIGGIGTSAPIGVGLVHSGGEGMFNGTSGILGIASANGPALNPTVFTPVMQLPAPYDAGSTLDIPAGGAGTWTLGPVQAPAGATAIPLVPASGGPASYPGGGTVYAKDVPLCWTIGTAAPTCGPTDFDLGNANTAVNATTFADLGASGDTLPAGTAISVATTQKQPLWSFTSGDTRGQDLVEVAPLGSTTEFNTGIEYFTAHLVAFDYAGGRLLVTPR